MAVLLSGPATSAWDANSGPVLDAMMTEVALMEVEVMEVPFLSVGLRTHICRCRGKMSVAAVLSPLATVLGPNSKELEAAAKAAVWFAKNLPTDTCHSLARAIVSHTDEATAVAPLFIGASDRERKIRVARTLCLSFLWGTLAELSTAELDTLLETHNTYMLYFWWAVRRMAGYGSWSFANFVELSRSMAGGSGLTLSMGLSPLAGLMAQACTVAGGGSTATSMGISPLDELMAQARRVAGGSTTATSISLSPLADLMAQARTVAGGGSTATSTGMSPVAKLVAQARRVAGGGGTATSMGPPLGRLLAQAHLYAVGGGSTFIKVDLMPLV